MRGLIAKAMFFVLTCSLLLGALESRLFAYADPGTGLLAVQYVFSLAVGAVIYFRRSLLKILRFSARSAPPEQK
ncbi:MAG TPA: hypothetical protein VMG63_24515 [Terriglobia bacterium]|jgi:hypothetical protein|nr:hypothetical protein [Terriglobia bacterium]